ncbi:MAG: hypothetical protein CMG46_04605 [Candidatus Marinimicrobia bacterium]|nr:hypothetical protein [Candidatus Neomarinimicrobiota bacterium]
MEQISGFVPTLLGALVLLVVGWVLAALVARAVRAAISRTGISGKLAEWFGQPKGSEALELEQWVGRIVFVILMLFVLVGFFQILGLSQITEPLNELLSSIFGFAPRLIAPVLLAIFAWIIATVLRIVIRKALSTINFDDMFKGAAENDSDRLPVTNAIAETVYWLTFLLFLPAILSPLNLEGLLSPVQGMIDQGLAFLPNILGAAVILIVGWIVARIVRRIVTNVLDAMEADRFSRQTGLQTALGDHRLSSVIGLIVFILILIPVLVASLNALELQAITAPASNMLDQVLAAIPNIFAAALVLVVAYVVAKVVAGLLTNLLAGIGFDRVLERIGLAKAEAKAGGRTPSQIVGYLLIVAVLLFAVVESLSLIGFDSLANLVTDFLLFSGNVILGLIIIGFGLFLANIAANAVKAAGPPQAGLLGITTRIAIIVLAVAMGMDQMGVASDIINIAFGIVVGSIAIAVAVAFGIGGREVAAQLVREWTDSITSKKK